VGLGLRNKESKYAYQKSKSFIHLINLFIFGSIYLLYQKIIFLFIPTLILSIY